MASDRFKRKEGRTLQQRWKMKHKDRADDIPNCPSIEDIVNVSTPNVTPSSEMTKTANPSSATASGGGGGGTAASASAAAGQSSGDDVSVEPETASTAREASDSAGRESSTIQTRPSRRTRTRRRRHQRPRRNHNHHSNKNLMAESTTSSSNFAIQGTASERRDDIPMCPDIENICDLDPGHLDDDMSLQRFSHAFYQLLDDFFVLLYKTAHFSKQHPRPTTIVGFIVASYLMICYLELSIAALIELTVQASWPIFHAFLLFVERFSANFGSFMRSSDDIIQGAYCDVAEVWCRHFQMMCADRCSFFSMALERLRKN